VVYIRNVNTTNEQNLGTNVSTRAQTFFSFTMRNAEPGVKGDVAYINAAFGQHHPWLTITIAGLHFTILAAISFAFDLTVANGMPS
jgi:NO-binding membrane sensor protein with MHYT domain